MSSQAPVTEGEPKPKSLSRIQEHCSCETDALSTFAAEGMLRTSEELEEKLLHSPYATQLQENTPAVGICVRQTCG